MAKRIQQDDYTKWTDEQVIEVAIIHSTKERFTTDLPTFEERVFSTVLNAPLLAEVQKRWERICDAAIITARMNGAESYHRNAWAR